MFTNVVPGSTEVVRPWVEALRNVGFAVFAKPKTTEDSDIDDDMLAHIKLRADEGQLEHVVVASGDGRAFREPLEELRTRGTYVTVIGFREHASFALTSDVIEFVDLEEIEGVFREPLPRISLDSLPDGGAWLPPFRSLGRCWSRDGDGDAAPHRARRPALRRRVLGPARRRRRRRRRGRITYVGARAAAPPLVGAGARAAGRAAARAWSTRTRTRRCCCCAGSAATCR